jgi:hypothetical protein
MYIVHDKMTIILFPHMTIFPHNYTTTLQVAELFVIMGV